ncbi:hypothetical protein PTE30175_00423 [Pandoraea terrae]|uniref:Acetate kinase n=1 Tax=Pandoraea terrae TaxID=1537710 RepID=A0A5E4RYX4_9BURK|nr:acetate kinase [Pandoraea terrae]VVD68041.1 hypothetical protein PTE30175_00423 [Pandoraea terrae]
MMFRAMRRVRTVGWTLAVSIGFAGGMCAAMPATAQEAGAQVGADSEAGSAEQLKALRAEVNDRLRRLDAMQRDMAKEEAEFRVLRNKLNRELLSTQRGGADPNAPGGAWADVSSNPMLTQQNNPGEANGPGAGNAATGDQQPAPVGRAPERETRPPEVAQIFEQPGVLTPKGTFILEPSFQFGYSSSNRVALVGYTIIPALLIGLIDVREVKTTTYTETMTVRYGITNRMEVEFRIPYVFSSGQTVSREVLQGTAVDNTFDTRGHGLGDIEMTGRYQINDGSGGWPYFVGWLRFKSRTGKDPFEVVTDCVTRCVSNTTGTGLPLQLPTGSGFYALQPGFTWLFPSDPAVFFGNFSYLHNFQRTNVSRTVLAGGQEFLGTIQPGDIFGFNIGMGLALNDRASFSIGYDQSIVGATKQNGQTIPGSVRTVLGSLIVGYSYRINKRSTLNVTIGAGLTRDTPDLSLTFRLPISF